MSKIRLGKQQQLTLPPEIIEQAGLRQHDVLEASYENGAIILRPIRSLEPGGPFFVTNDTALRTIGGLGAVQLKTLKP